MIGRMDAVLFFQSTTGKSWRQKLAGAFSDARERGWLLQVADGGDSPRRIREALRTWRPIGCLVDRAQCAGCAPDAAFGELPVVYLDQDPVRPSVRHPCVLHDSAATARAAARELLDTGRSSFGFVGSDPPRFWSREREAAFRNAVRAAGGRFSSYRRGPLGAWLAALPRPCAVLAANDATAQRVHHAARACGLRIPQDMALCGVDNDELFCEAVQPGITSVAPDFEEAGRRLSAALAREIERPGSGPALVRYGPLKVVRRGSSGTIAHPLGNPRVGQALDFVRANACLGPVRLDDVARAMGCSRRLATRLFRDATGKSVLEAVHDARFEHACELLRLTDKPVFLVVAECGYASESFFKREFARRTGRSMRQYRIRG